MWNGSRHEAELGRWPQRRVNIVRPTLQSVALFVDVAVHIVMAADAGLDDADVR